MKSKIATAQIEKAVAALFKNKTKESDNDLLGSDVGYINLDIATHKINNKKSLNPILLPLEHSAFMEGVEVCLFVKNDVDAFKEKIKAQGVDVIKEVISTLDLKTKYKTYEARGKLALSYNVFLCDDRVIHLMPQLLGKRFLDIGKNPIGIRVSRGNIKTAVEKIMKTATYTPNNGLVNTIKVGNFTMSEKDVVSNIEGTMSQFVSKAATSWSNVRQIGVKSKGTPLLPIYAALPQAEPEEEAKKENETTTKKASKKEAADKTPSPKNKASTAKKAESTEKKAPATKKAPASIEKKTAGVKKTPVAEKKTASAETKSVGQKRKATEAPVEEKKAKAKAGKAAQPAKKAKATKKSTK